MEFTSFGDVQEYLDAIPKFQTASSSAADFNLQKFTDFCAEIGNPQDAFPSIHVGGTNGKGSCCKILSTIYREAGYNVGVYSSPHILTFNERFNINGNCISDEDLLLFFQCYHHLIEEHRLTYFEISTAIAFWWFANSEIDIGIIEVGLGGRLDATNVVRPLVSVITSVALDHTDLLGDTLEQIAREKAGIIKEDRPVVLGKIQEEAEAVIMEVAEDQGSTVYSVEELSPRITKKRKLQLQINGHRKVYDIPPMAPVQAINMAISYRVVALLSSYFDVSEVSLRKALRELPSISARFEKLGEDLNWYFDGGHNREAIQALKEAVDSVGAVEESILVLSLMRDKVNNEVMNEFSEFKNIYYYTLNTKRAAPFEDIAKWLPQVMKFPTHLHEQRRLLKVFKSELVIFAGSFYFYATVRDWIQELD
ncbi:bifunctional folylpolyglutamate synthase/dihydrofolate synthase [Aliifodinibius salicampi]|uniref:Bifunctional folylpolyglutamate synthase/dihydrofolate synthase n=1 Tax=Fodinibius salicampi TaxID=1920655 RepID=A0ABT3PXX5_9BACT|nr:folylpolyglutamate synthase/dihydrofolate synthase family protein [Fodinibius salicampi]MCW9712706.1 bifunctional folylpolyglutamate synthase/dihydrofolate synthase [Fodinibius salicampi]